MSWVRKNGDPGNRVNPWDEDNRHYWTPVLRRNIIWFAASDTP
jgi:hypothetical protein